MKVFLLIIAVFGGAQALAAKKVGGNPPRGRPLEVIAVANEPADFKRRGELECSAVDRSADLGPVRDQSGIGWCYAFAISDLVGAKLNKRLSAFDLAVASMRKKTRHSLSFFNDSSGGAVNATFLEALDRGGFCLEEANLSEDPFVAGTDMPGIQAFEMIIELERLKKNPEGESRFCAQFPLIQSFFPNVDMESYLKILIATDSANVIVDALNKHTCKDARLPGKGLTLVDTWTAEKRGDQWALVAELDREIGNGNVVGITYDPMGFRSGRDGEMALPQEENKHMSIIVGRKFNRESHKCEYLLRNSWGANCSQYAARFRCDEKKGHAWVSEEYLARALMDSIHYLR